MSMNSGDLQLGEISVRSKKALAISLSSLIPPIFNHGHKISEGVQKLLFRVTPQVRNGNDRSP